MKERGILFRDRLVRAILDDRKTQTRRIIKTPPPDDHQFPNEGQVWRGVAEFGWTDHDGDSDDTSHWPAYGEFIACPYGGPGARLWVREAWSRDDGGHIFFRADGGRYGIPWGEWIRWKPGIHLFRKDARIVLDIVNVRVQRLQDISEEDAIAEGLVFESGVYEGAEGVGFSDPRKAFASLWDTINGDTPGASWAANPWVWAITFRRVQP